MSPNVQTSLPSFPITPTSAFSSTSCLQLLVELLLLVHTTTPCDVKSLLRYARRGRSRLNSNRGVSAAAVLPSLGRVTFLPTCSYAFTIGKFRRWWSSSPPRITFGGWQLFPAGFPLCPRSNSGLHLNQLFESKALLLYPRP